jgi:hypothetical protein
MPWRSPYLIACDFLLRGQAKEEVYRTKSVTLNELEQQIRDTFTAVALDILGKSTSHGFSKLQKCVQMLESMLQLPTK